MPEEPAFESNQFAKGAGSIPGSQVIGYYDSYNISFVGTSWITERLRGYWRVGYGIIPPVDGVFSYTGLKGDGGFGIEYFPAKDSAFSFGAMLGATRAAAIVGSSDFVRAPYGNGVVAALTIQYYRF